MSRNRLSALIIFTVMVAALSVPPASATAPDVVLRAHTFTMDEPIDGPTPTPTLRGTLTTRSGPTPTRPPVARQRVEFVPVATPTPTPTPLPTPVPPPPAPRAAWPVPGGSISQLFSAVHPALDIFAPCGTPAVAAWSGTVVYAGWKDNGGGNVVDIRFDNGLLGSYNHLQGIYVSGGRVAAGTALGAVGMTGIATGCHLHFAMESGGVWVNPLAFL